MLCLSGFDFILKYVLEAKIEKVDELSRKPVTEIKYKRGYTRV